LEVIILSILGSFLYPYIFILQFTQLLQQPLRVINYKFPFLVLCVQCIFFLYIYISFAILFIILFLPVILSSFNTGSSLISHSSLFSFFNSVSINSESYFSSSSILILLGTISLFCIYAGFTLSMFMCFLFPPFLIFTISIVFSVVLVTLYGPFHTFVSFFSSPFFLSGLSNQTKVLIFRIFPFTFLLYIYFSFTVFVSGSLSLLFV